MLENNRNGIPTISCYNYIPNPPLRTNQSLFNDAEAATENGHPVRKKKEKKEEMREKKKKKIVFHRKMGSKVTHAFHSLATG